MSIVPVGNVIIQVPAQGTPGFVWELVEQIQRSQQAIAERILTESLAVEVERFLGRKWYVRRKQGKRQESGVYCSKCRSHQRQHFYRNGHYERRLNSQWGQLVVQVPQIKCRCGGNVRFQYETIRSRKRFWDDLELEIQIEYGRGLSYRQIKVALDQRLESSVGLRTLNRRVLALGQASSWFKTWAPGTAPPVVRLDGIWVTVMLTTDQTHIDQLGRKRPVKQAMKLPILAAQAVWPDSGRTELIAWMRAAAEDTPSWQAFLEALWESGVRREHGLALLVADGSLGLRAAYENVYWQVPFQRCIFHKLRNVARDLRPPAALDRQAARAFSTNFLLNAAHIWQAQDEFEAHQVMTAFCQAWQAAQPKAIRTLQRDFEDTLAFFSVQEQAEQNGEIWPSHFLRTTSPLERMFREFRQRFRQAVIFHSLSGLQAATAQLASRFS